VSILGLATLAATGCRIESNDAGAPEIDPARLDPPTFGPVRTVAYRVPDIDAARNWYSVALDSDPILETASSVHFRVAGLELRLDADNDDGPDAALDSAATPRRNPGPIVYWAVDDIDAVAARLIRLGAKTRSPIRAREGERVTILEDPFGIVFGLLQEAAGSEGRS
jgi:lactoylglutathione lyase